jgi:tetratricopeptide (TPR) repeat protein
LYQAQGEYTPALVYYEQALVIFQNINARYNEAAVLSYMAEAYLYQKDQTDAAATYVEQALNIAQDIGAREIGYRCYHTLAQIHERQGDFKQALAHYEHYYAVKHSVFNEQADQRLKNLEIAHEVETTRKEAEIARLKNIELEREITERRRAEAALQASAAKTTALYQLVRTLASHDTLPTMLQAVVKTVANKLPASQTIIHTFQQETKQVTHFVEGRSGFEHPFHPPMD